jgi:hypothetical protein
VACHVIIEVVDSSSVAGAAMSRQIFDLPGISLDHGYAPVRLAAEHDRCGAMPGTGRRARGSVLLRGLLDEAKAGELCAHPAILAIWADAPILPPRHGCEPAVAAAAAGNRRDPCDRCRDAASGVPTVARCGRQEPGLVAQPARLSDAISACQAVLAARDRRGLAISLTSGWGVVAAALSRDDRLNPDHPFSRVLVAAIAIGRGTAARST